MTTPASETNPEGTTEPENLYADLPKPPMAPPSKATTKISLILQPVSFPPQMAAYLTSKGADLAKLQFDTERLIIFSVRGGGLKENVSEKDKNFGFVLRGIRHKDKLCLRVEESPSDSEIKVGHIFHDINALEQLVSDSESHFAGYPIVSLMVEPNTGI